MEKDSVPAEGPILLTDREKEIISLLAKGMLDKEMAYTLGISIYTVKNHLKSIYQKLKVDNRLEAVIWFFNLDETSNLEFTVPKIGFTPHPAPRNAQQ